MDGQAVSDLSSLQGAEGRELTEGQIHLWYCAFDPESDPPDRDRYLAMLTPDERARGERYKFDRHRRQHWMTRALVRTTLSRYAPIAPEDWRFEAGEWGKPSIARNQARGLHFNLTNTEGLVVCAVSRSVSDLGIDVEASDRRVDALELARAKFAPVEAEAVCSASGKDRMERFFAHWTLKESYIKACGKGLAIPLRHFWFDVSDGARIAFDEALPDDPQAWWFRRYTAIDRYRVALAARVAGGAEPSVCSSSCVP